MAWSRVHTWQEAKPGGNNNNNAQNVDFFIIIFFSFCLLYMCEDQSAIDAT